MVEVRRAEESLSSDLQLLFINSATEILPAKVPATSPLEAVLLGGLLVGVAGQLQRRQ